MEIPIVFFDTKCHGFFIKPKTYFQFRKQTAYFNKLSSVILYVSKVFKVHKIKLKL